MSWRGHGLHFDTLTSRSTPVEVAIEGDRLLFTLDGVTRRYAPEEVKDGDRTLQGEARLHLAHPPGAVLTLPPDAVPHLEAGKFLRTRVRQAAFVMRNVVIVGSVFLALVLAFLLLGIRPLSQQLAKLIPADAERAVGQAVYDGVARTGLVTTDSLSAAALRKVVLAVLPEDLSPDQVRVALLEDTLTVNAFALPGGFVVVHRGILNLMEDESELLGVVAHEIGHVYERHGMRRLTRTATLGVLTALVFGDVGGLGSILVQHGTSLLSLSYDRDEERAADAFAVRTLIARNLDPGGLKRLFSKLEAQEGSLKLPALLSSHPATAERMTRLESLVAEAGGPPPAPRALLSPAESAALFRRTAPRASY